MSMKKYRLRTVSIALCLSVMAFSGAGYSEELPKAKADPGKNATWTEEAVKENYIMNCAPCHGETGKGNGPLAVDSFRGVKPRNLNNAKLMSARTDEDLFKATKFGGESVGFFGRMPSWRDTFTDVEIKQIVQYVRKNICKCEYNEKK
ncbi:MAG: cytochrome c [Betaproteobacteria bacterium]|nr:cytochrome c [Betaproteobacteria bacterium]